MSLYPSLEDMKVDRLYQAQFQAEGISAVTQSEPVYPPAYASSYPMAPGMPQPDLTPSAFTDLSYPALSSASPDLPYPLQPSAPLYPSLNEYMGLELTPTVIAANMPEYMPQNQQVAVRQNFSVSSLGGLVAPLSGNDRGLQRAHVTNGIGELSLCKDGSNKLGIRVQAVNNGIFISLVQKDSSAAAAGLRFGDQILQVQGKNVAGMTADQVHNLIKKAPDTGLNIVVRDRPLERTVTLHKDSAGKIGFQFKNGKITHLVVDSSAARNGLLTEHQLLEVNGQNVVGMKDKDITKIIDGSGTIVTITIIPTFIYDHMTKKIAQSIFSTMDHSVW